MLFSSRHFAVVPDLFRGNDWDKAKGFGEDFQAWRNNLTTQQERISKDLDNVIQYVKDKGYKKLGIIGFCWGGGQAQRIAKMEGVVDAAVSLHGPGVEVSEITEFKVPLLLVCPEFDKRFPKASAEVVQKEIDARPEITTMKTILYLGVEHGFANRGDYSKEPEKSAAEKAWADTNDWLVKYLTSQ